jgi:hypothetical protein
MPATLLRLNIGRISNLQKLGSGEFPDPTDAIYISEDGLVRPEMYSSSLRMLSESSNY